MAKASELNPGKICCMIWSAEGCQQEWHPDSWWLITACWNNGAKEMVHITPRVDPHIAALGWLYSSFDKWRANTYTVLYCASMLLHNYSSGLALEVSQHNWAVVKLRSSKVTWIHRLSLTFLLVYEPFNWLFTLLHTMWWLLFKLMNNMILLKMYSIWEWIWFQNRQWNSSCLSEAKSTMLNLEEYSFLSKYHSPNTTSSGGLGWLTDLMSFNSQLEEHTYMQYHQPQPSVAWQSYNREQKEHKVTLVLMCTANMN